MPKATFDDEEDDEDREAPDDEDADWNLEPATIACPYCRAEISEDASRCPECGQYISAEDARPARKPLWIWIGLFFCVILLLLFIFR